MVLREHKDPLNTSRGIMGPLENSAGVQNNRGRLKQRFDLIRKLGQGTYGKVQLGIDKETGQEVAIKTIKKSKIETEADLIRIRREIQIMSSVRHPNIIHIYEVFENREKMVLVMEYAAGGELYDYLNERRILQEDEARRIFRQIASAVYYCHKNKICHRDLKLENILLDEKSNAKIADFGLSNVFDDVNLLKTFCGSPLYASPEIVKGTPYSGPEVDCWSLGVLLYTLVYGAMPFDGSNFKRLVKQISAGEYYEPKSPAEASPLIRTMLTVDPNRRAKVDDICSHQWINQGFDENCLKSAEDLAKQTPVRLDVLLTLAPNHNINHSQVVIPDAQETTQNEEGGAKALSSINHTTNRTESDSTVNDPPKKPKLQGDVSQKDSSASGTPAKPKRKTQVKSKSKTTPLMLDLIQDVVEEEVEGDVEMPCVPQDHVTAAEKSQQRDKDDDDEGDTLSEISEIQTLAEDIGKEGGRTKESRKSVKKGTSAASDTNSHESRSKGTKTTASSAAATASVPSPKSNKTESVKPKESSASTVSKTPSEKPTTETAEVPKPPMVKKKSVKSKAPVVETVETVPKPKDESENKPKAMIKDSPAQHKPQQEEAVVKPEEKIQKEVPTKSKSKTPESPERQKSEEKGSSDNDKQRKLIRQRSGSSEVSPTRVERRNSKVISQKTAELIQNLETKATTSGGASSGSGRDSSTEGRPPGIKKLVIPSFNKVSDAKSKFETKPPRPIGSSLMSHSKAAFEAKAQQSQQKPPLPTQSSVEKTKEVNKPEVVNKEKESIAPPPASKSKSKSPSPTPTKEAEVIKSPQEEKEPKTLTLEAQKEKPKVVKGSEQGKSGTEATNKAETDKPTTSDPEGEKVVPKKAPGKIQIPAGLQAKQPEVTKPAAPVVKNKPTVAPAATPIPEATTSTSPTTETESKLITKPSPQNKEQAAKKITSVINKIVTSGSTDEKKFVPNKSAETPSSHKTEVSFPVVAAPSQERVIPIKFEDSTEVQPEENQISSPPPSTTGSRTQIHRFPPRLDSFKKFDSAGSMFSRQTSSDTESCASLAPPKPEPIRKSPREFLIPIKLEASGQTVTPKEDIATLGSEDDFRIDSRLRSGRFGRQKRYSSLLSDSSLDEEPSVSVSQAAGSRRDSTATNASTATTGNHVRSCSQGDEPETPSTASTFKRYRIKRPDLDRSDSFSSAEEDDEDFFEVLTADSLFSNLLDRVRNLTKRINREGSMGPNWPTVSNDPTNFGLWNPSSSLRDLMNRAPSETRTFGSTAPGGFTVSSHRSYSREPSVSVTINSTGGGVGASGSGTWRRSLSRDVSGDSDASGSINPPSRNYGGKPLATELFETTSVRSLPISLQSRRSPSYLSQRSEPFGSELSQSSTTSGRQSLYNSTTTPATSSRHAYGRTLSNTEYGGNNISRTLPLRRSLKNFDRSTTTSDYSMDSVLSAIRGLGQSLIDSPATFDPDSYLRQLRSMSRDREWDRESSVSKMSSISEQDQGANDQLGAFNNSSTNLSQSDVGSGGGFDESELQQGKLSVQEKMNNYQQYYQNLASPSPLKRFQLTNPSQSQTHVSTNSPSNSASNVPLGQIDGSSVGIGLARLRPNTMYETSYASTGVSGMSNTSQQTVNHRNNVEQHRNPVASSSSQIDNYNKESGTTNNQQIYANQNQSGHLLMKSNKKQNEEPSPASNALPVETNENRRPSLNSEIPKWPGVSIQQYRPLSISSFPNTDDSQGLQQQNRTSSVVRMVSPPPKTKDEIPSTSTTNANVIKKRETAARATSVERITRFLERKSVPREMTPSSKNDMPPKPNSTNTTINSPEIPSSMNSPPISSNDTLIPSNDKSTSKLTKPKFLQSLEKKWEKFTTKSDTPDMKASKNSENLGVEQNTTLIGQATGDDVNQNDEILNSDNKISESVLLRRAVSPEKKLKKFGSGTVNFMLGKFKKFDEPNPLATSNSNSNFPTSVSTSSNKLQPSPSGKPPVGNTSSKIGRRVQSVYAGAASDSVLTLPPQHHLRIPNSKPPIVNSSTTSQPQDPTPEPNARSGHCPMTNGHTDTVDELSSTDAEADLIRSAEIAQQKRRSLRLDTRCTSPAPQQQSTYVPSSGPTVPPPPSPKPQRPYSLGMFSPTTATGESMMSTGSKNASLIPRPHIVTLRSSSPPGTLSPPLTSNAEPITIKSMSPPEITIHDHNHHISSPLQSPTSISDSMDSSSVCSDKNDPNKNLNSILDDEESVSDRIFRKSFYSRFNSIDRAKRSASLSAASAVRKGLQPIGVNNSALHARATSVAREIKEKPTATNRNPFHKAQSVDRSLAPSQPQGRVVTRTISPDPTVSSARLSTDSNNISNGHHTQTPNQNVLSNDNINSDLITRPKSPSPHTLVINKYNPNPLFKELITDEFKSDVEKKTEYSRKVTSKLSKLLKEIESDLNTCNLNKNDDDEDDSSGLINGGGDPLMRSSSPNNIGVGLKALVNGSSSVGGSTTPVVYNSNFKKYGGSKTTHLTVDNILNKRNQLFNKSRENSVQPNNNTEMRQRSKTPTTTTAIPNNNTVGVGIVNGSGGGGISDGCESSSNNNSNDSMTTER